MEALAISILASLAAGAIAWCAQHVRRRHYLLRAVRDDIRRQRQNITEIRDYLAAFFKTSISVDSKIDIAARFERSDGAIAQILTAEVTQNAPGLLRQMIAFYEAIRTIEVLFGNCMAEVTILKNAEKPLSAEDVKYLGEKERRIMTMCELVLKKTKNTKLSALPTKYVDQVPPLDMHDAIRSIYRTT